MKFSLVEVVSTKSNDGRLELKNMYKILHQLMHKLHPNFQELVYNYRIKQNLCSIAVNKLNADSYKTRNHIDNLKLTIEEN